MGVFGKGVERDALGRLGEELAARHLARKGWAIVERNLRSGRREVDLLVRRGDVLAFVEVKTRRSRDFGHPLEAVHHRKRMEVTRVARDWLSTHPQGRGIVRFDAVAVVLGPGGFGDR
jgi:putative endonuclease